MIPTLKDFEAYVTRGLVYAPGVFDCASLVVLVQRELFNRRVIMPAAGSRSAGRRGQAKMIDQQKQTLTTKVEQPFTGCAVLFWQSTGTGRPPLNRSWHIGTCFVQDGITWVLHASRESTGVVLKKLTDLLHQGMHLEGFYKWK